MVQGSGGSGFGLVGLMLGAPAAIEAPMREEAVADANPELLLSPPHTIQRAFRRLESVAGPLRRMGADVGHDGVEKEGAGGEYRLVGPVEETGVGEEEFVLSFEAANAATLNCFRGLFDVEGPTGEIPRLGGTCFN